MKLTEEEQTLVERIIKCQAATEGFSFDKASEKFLCKEFHHNDEIMYVDCVYRGNVVYRMTDVETKQSKNMYECKKCQW